MALDPQRYDDAAAATGKRLVQVRTSLMRNQLEFASDLGMHPNTLGRYERGERLPDGDLLLQVAMLGFNAHWVMTGKGPMYTEPDLLDFEPPPPCPNCGAEAVQSDIPGMLRCSGVPSCGAALKEFWKLLPRGGAPGPVFRTAVESQPPAPHRKS